jgi:hypothetical protein
MSMLSAQHYGEMQYIDPVLGERAPHRSGGCVALELTAPEGDLLRVLGKQRVDSQRPNPFIAAGNSEFNALIRMPPAGDRDGDIVLVARRHAQRRDA